MPIDAESTEVHVDSKQHQLLSDAAMAAGVHLDLRCGGNGVCKRCAVQWGGKTVLACQTAPAVKGVMSVPVSSQVAEKWAVESAFVPPVPRAANPRCVRVVVTPPRAVSQDGEDDWRRLCAAGLFGSPVPAAAPSLLARLPGLIAEGVPVRITVLDGVLIDLDAASNPAPPVLGVAVDVGTTTVALRLIDLTSGDQLASSGTQNRQVGLGANVISRIDRGSNKRGLDLLQKLIIDKTIAPMIERCLARAAARPDDVYLAVLAGNTVMTHLLLGLPPNGLGRMPFSPVTLTPAAETGAAFGMPARVAECLPCASAYIGGDVVGGAYVLGFDRAGPPELLIDIGTNSEMILRNGNKLFAASAPAGPAFEGGGLLSGGPATPGAVTHLKYDGRNLEVQTLHGEPATHICGSAYVDFLALGRERGFLTENGRFVGPRPQLQSKAGDGRTGLIFEVAKGVGITEQDVALLLQAKAAVLSGVNILLKVAGVAPSELKAVHIAGGFGRHLDLRNAIRAALLPEFSMQALRLVGNTSLSACSVSLLNADARAGMREMARRIQVIELNLQSEFEDSYISSLPLP